MNLYFRKYLLQRTHYQINQYLSFPTLIYFMEDATEEKYSVLEKTMLLLQPMDSKYLTKNGFKLINKEIKKEPDYERIKKEDSPLNPDLLPEYVEETFELDMILNGKKIIYWRRNRCHDNLASMNYMRAGIQLVTIIEVDPDFMGNGGLFVCNDVLNEEEIERLNNYMNKTNETTEHHSQTKLFA